MSELLVVLAQASQTENPDGGSAAIIIIVTLIVAAVVIGGVLRFVAKRGSRTPKHDPHDPDQVGRV